jgi:hypothetical protein
MRTLFQSPALFTPPTVGHKGMTAKPTFMDKIFGLLFSFIILTNISFGQSLDYINSVKQETVSDIKSDNVETVFSIIRLCTDISIITHNEKDKLCAADNNYYWELFVFWEHNGHSYVKKIDNCIERKPIKVDTIGFKEFWTTNWREILKEQRREALTIETINGGTVYAVPDIVNYCFIKIQIENNGMTYTDSYYDYFFDTNLNNFSGEFNQSLKQYGLHREIYKTMKNINLIIDRNE